MKKLFFEKLDSTNLWVKDNWKDLEDKTVVYTFKQTSGIGKFNRKWINIAEENLFFSIVLKPKSKISELSGLTLFAAEILCDLLKSYGLSPSVKLPNDVMVNNKKISGILAQSVIEGSNLKMICLGMGINVNAQRDLIEKVSQPVTAINIEQAVSFSVEKVLNDYLNLFFKNYRE